MIVFLLALLVSYQGFLFYMWPQWRKPLEGSVALNPDVRHSL